MKSLVMKKSGKKGQSAPFRKQQAPGGRRCAKSRGGSGAMWESACDRAAPSLNTAHRG